MRVLNKAIGTWFFPAVLVVLYLSYAAATIHLSSFMVNGTRYYCLFDDAMISMRYAWNLAHGHGLVYNPGARVEGITNPLWTLIMAIVHLVVQDKALTPLPVQILNALISAAIIILTYRTSLRIFPSSPGAAFIAAAISGFYYPFIFFTLHGMETGLLGLLVILALYYCIPMLQQRRFSPIPLILLGIATLSRIDMAGLFLLTGALSLLLFRSSPLRPALWFGSLGLFFLGGQTLLRWWYYGDVFPNTYYLKMTGFPAGLRILRGFTFTWPFVWHFWPYVLLAGAAVILPRLRPSASPAPFSMPQVQFVALLGLMSATQVAYSTYVGGDAWEEDIFCNRYILVAWPAIALLLGTLAIRLRPLLPSRVMHGRWALHIISAIGCVSWLNYRPDVPVATLPMLLQTVHPLIKTNHQHLDLAGWARQNIPHDALIAVDMAGAFAYNVPNPCHDMLGKSDRHIARLPMRNLWSVPVPQNRLFYPGHMKFDPAYSLAKHPVCLIFGWSATDIDARTLYEGKYYPVNTSVSKARVFLARPLVSGR